MENFRPARLLALAILVVMLGRIDSIAAVRTVALSGQTPPGMADVVSYAGFSAPALNAAGQVAFHAWHTGDSMLGDEGIWSEGSGALELVARTASQAPGTPVDTHYRSFGDPVINSLGQTAFYAQLMGVNVDENNDRGIWSEGSGSLELVARKGSHAPGTPTGVHFADEFDVTTPALNDVGHTSFYAQLSGNGVDSTNDRGIWSKLSGGLELVSRKGSPAPSTASGVNFNGFSGLPFPPQMDGKGRTVFYSALTGSGVDATNDRGIWSNRSGTLDLVARSGTRASGLADGVEYSSFYSTALNASGHIAFGALMTGNGEVLTNRGIWAERSGELDLVAWSGSQAPGTTSGVNFEVLLSPVLNDAGQTAFVSTLSGSVVDDSNDSGIWSEGTGTLELVARKGSHAPGTPDNVRFGSESMSLFTPFSTPILNAEGKISFHAYLIGSGINEANDEGIWVTDSSGVLQLIAREGDLLEVAPGDIRIVNRLDFVTGTGNGNGYASGFNDLGQAAFVAAFTDGSQGIFVTLPSTATLPGDFDNDGDVDGRDFLLWQRDTSVGNLADWQANYGAEGLGAIAVPEPNTATFLLGGILLIAIFLSSDRHESIAQCLSLRV